jgi:hypothetical protein
MNKYSRQKASRYALYRHANRGSASFIAPQASIANFFDPTDPSAYMDAAGQAWQNVRGMFPGGAPQAAPTGVDQLQGLGNRLGGLLQGGRPPVPYNPGATQPSGIYQGIQNIAENFAPPPAPSTSGIQSISEIMPGQNQGFLQRAGGAIGDAFNSAKGYVMGHPGVDAAAAGGVAAAGAGGLGLRNAARNRQLQQQAAAQAPGLMQRAQALAANPMARRVGLGALALGGLGAGVAGMNALQGQDDEQAQYARTTLNQYVASFSRGNGTRFSSRGR